jgi:hypothetical protein
LTDIAALGIAALAFIYSSVLGALNGRTAKRALALSELQEARRDATLDLYLISSTARHSVSTGDRVLEFDIQVSNPSDRSSSVVAAELHVTYSVQRVMTTVKIQHGNDENAGLATPGT